MTDTVFMVIALMGIHSERRRSEEVHLSPAYRWFCKMDLTGAILGNSIFSKNRHGRFRDSDVLREVFETAVGNVPQRHVCDACVRGDAR